MNKYKLFFCFLTTISLSYGQIKKPKNISVVSKKNEENTFDKQEIERKLNLYIKNKEISENGKKRVKNYSKSNSSTLPNMIVILADDLGYGDLGSWGHPTSRTPHIDKLVSKSRVLTQFYVTSPICSPSRY